MSKKKHRKTFRDFQAGLFSYYLSQNPDMQGKITFDDFFDKVKAYKSYRMKYVVYVGKDKKGVIRYVGTTIQYPLSRWYYHHQHGNKLNFEVVCRFSNEKQMLEKEYELIQKYLSNGLRNKITNREQNYNVELTQEEVSKRIGDPHWCQGCYRRHVSPGYKYCYFCEKEMLR